jgi:hypothetical protein
MKYDLIIVSQSVGDLIKVTENCINSARKDGADLNIIVVETGNPYKYDVDKIVQYNGPFNYNRALNLGLKYRKGDIYILANNDLVFHPGWSKIGELMQSNNLHSASVLSRSINGFERGEFIYEGYKVGSQFLGWCIFIDEYCLNRIGKLDESVMFWYSDNLMACQLKAAGIRHGLFCNMQIDHITSLTLNRQDLKTKRQYRVMERQKYKRLEQEYASRNYIRKNDTKII